MESEKKKNGKKLRLSLVRLIRKNLEFQNPDISKKTIQISVIVSLFIFLLFVQYANTISWYDQIQNKRGFYSLYHVVPSKPAELFNKLNTLFYGYEDKIEYTVVLKMRLSNIVFSDSMANQTFTNEYAIIVVGSLNYTNNFFNPKNIIIRELGLGFADRNSLSEEENQIFFKCAMQINASKIDVDFGNGINFTTSERCLQFVSKSENFIEYFERKVTQQKDEDINFVIFVSNNVFKDIVDNNNLTYEQIWIYRFKAQLFSFQNHLELMNIDEQIDLSMKNIISFSPYRVISLKSEIQEFLERNQRIIQDNISFSVLAVCVLYYFYFSSIRLNSDQIGTIEAHFVSIGKNLEEIFDVYIKKIYNKQFSIHFALSVLLSLLLSCLFLLINSIALHVLFNVLYNLRFSVIFLLILLYFIPRWIYSVFMCHDLKNRMNASFKIETKKGFERIKKYVFQILLFASIGYFSIMIYYIFNRQFYYSIVYLLEIIVAGCLCVIFILFFEEIIANHIIKKNSIHPTVGKAIKRLIQGSESRIISIFIVVLIFMIVVPLNIGIQTMTTNYYIDNYIDLEMKIEIGNGASDSELVQLLNFPDIEKYYFVNVYRVDTFSRDQLEVHVIDYDSAIRNGIPIEENKIYTQNRKSMESKLMGCCFSVNGQIISVEDPLLVEVKNLDGIIPHPFLNISAPDIVISSRLLDQKPINWTSAIITIALSKTTNKSQFLENISSIFGAFLIDIENHESFALKLNDLTPMFNYYLSSAVITLISIGWTIYFITSEQAKIKSNIEKKIKQYSNQEIKPSLVLRFYRSYIYLFNALILLFGLIIVMILIGFNLMILMFF